MKNQSTKKKKEQMRVAYLGMIFLLDRSVSEYQGEVSVVISRVNAAKMIRQFIKAKFPKKVKSWVTSDSFSGGSSINVYVCKLNGEPLLGAIFEEIETFSKSLKAGSFDGMTDSYNYRESIETDNGTKLNFYTSYISVDNNPKYGTPEHDLYVEYRTNQQNKY